MKVFINKQMPDSILQPLKAAGISITQFTERRDLNQQELIAYCSRHDALLSAGRNNIDETFLTACRHLKVIALMSVGYDNVDVAAATRLRVPVSNTPGVLSKATAETSFLLMIAAARKAFFMHKKIINGEWGFFNPFDNLGIELEGATLGVFGLGNIGYQMAKKCIGAYGMRVIYYNRNTNSEAEKDLKAVKVSYDELLQRSDVLSVHASLTPETKNKFDKTAFSRMKKTSIFINAARGAIHNEQDLTAALLQGTIWGAGLDVTNPEPMDKQSPLLSIPSVAVLPHIGSATEQTRRAMAGIAVENIIAGFKGEWLPQIINPAVYEPKK